MHCPMLRALKKLDPLATTAIDEQSDASPDDEGSKFELLSSVSVEWLDAFFDIQITETGQQLSTF